MGPLNPFAGVAVRETESVRVAPAASVAQLVALARGNWRGNDSERVNGCVVTLVTLNWRVDPMVPVMAEPRLNSEDVMMRPAELLE
jgi:hypothetical protein